MTPSPCTEDTLLQQTTADYLERQRGSESVYAHHHENFGPKSWCGGRTTGSLFRSTADHPHPTGPDPAARRTPLHLRPSLFFPPIPVRGLPPPDPPSLLCYAPRPRHAAQLQPSSQPPDPPARPTAVRTPQIDFARMAKYLTE